MWISPLGFWPWGEIPREGRSKRYLRRVLRRFAVERFAVDRFAVLRFAVERFAVLRFAVLRFAVDRFAVRRFAVPERDVAAGIAGTGAASGELSSSLEL